MTDFSSEQIIHNLSTAIKKIKKLEGIKKIAFEIAYSSDLPKVFSIILDTGMELTNSDYGFIALYDKHSNLLNIKAQIGLDDSKNAKYSYELGREGVIGRAAQKKKYQIVNNVTQDKDFIPFFPDAKSEFAMPLINNNGDLLGIFNLECNREKRYNKQSIDIITPLSDLTVIAISKEIQHQIDLQNNSIIALLNKIDKSIINPDITLEETLEIVLNEGLNLIGTDIGFIQLVEEQTNELRIVAVTQYHPIDENKVRYKIGTEGITGYVASKLKPIIIDDVRKSPLKVGGKEINYIPFFKDICSEMTVPLVFDKKLIGIFDANSLVCNFFNSDKLALIKKLTDQAAISIALSKARMMDEQTDILDVVDETSAAAIHWVSNKVISLSGAMNQMQKSLKWERLSAEGKQEIEERISIVNDVLSQMKSVCSITLGAAKPEVKKDVDLYKYFQKVIKSFSIGEEIRVKIIKPVNKLPLLNVDIINFEVVIDNLFTNAKEAMDDFSNKEITISFKHETSSNSVLVYFSDNGKGIAMDKLSKIFTPFYTEKRKGTGLGLAVTHRIIRKMGFSISVDSELDHGTTFIIDIPISKAAVESDGN